MRILGIDPGTAKMGVGLIEGTRKKGFSHIKHFCLTTPANSKIDRRLKDIFVHLDAIVKETEPDLLALETLFFNKNVKTVMAISRVSGVALAAAAINGVETVEFTPLQVKSAITGFGRADKKQVQQMIKLLLKLKEIPQPDDAADALAIALCAGVSL